VTLPKNIESLALQLQAVARKHNLRHVKLSIYLDHKRDADQLGMEVSHRTLGDLDMRPEGSSVFESAHLPDGDASQAREAIALGVSRLVKGYSDEVEETERSILCEQEKLTGFQKKASDAALLNPGVLDELVQALYE